MNNQIRALILKMFSFQSKRIGTNFCQVEAYFIWILNFTQILTPFLCLISITILRHFLLTNLSSHTIPISSPLPFNVPSLYNYFHLGELAVQYSSCLTWYAYNYDDKYTRNDAIGRRKEQSYIDSIFQNKMNEIFCHYKIYDKNHKDQIFTLKRVPFLKKIKVQQFDL